MADLDEVGSGKEVKMVYAPMRKEEYDYATRMKKSAGFSWRTMILFAADVLNLLLRFMEGEIRGSDFIQGVINARERRQKETGKAASWR